VAALRPTVPRFQRDDLISWYAKSWPVTIHLGERVGSDSDGTRLDVRPQIAHSGV
jgi:hypothetical protein